MFKTKEKNHTMKAFRKSLMAGGNVLSNRVSDGMKYAQDQIVFMGDYMRKNPSMNFIKKSPANGILAAAGLGLIAYSIFKMIKR